MSSLRIVTRLACWLSAPALALVCVLCAAETTADDDMDLYKEAELYYEVRRLILNDFVREVTPREVAEASAQGMLKALDPYSRYYPPAAAAALHEDLSGEFVGIGVSVEERDGAIVVVKTMAGSPAEKAGVLAEDVLLSVDGFSLEGLSVSEAAKLIRGKIGMSVTVVLQRVGRQEPVELSIVRDTIAVDSVPEALMIDEVAGVGYLRIEEFQTNTPDSLDAKMRRLCEEEGCKKLILDLRNNPGGSLSGCVTVCDRFISSGVLLTTKSRSGESRTFEAGTQDDYPDMPVVVLVNADSASASEVLAGCLKDRQRAVLVGERTFGKGSVQKIVDLNSLPGASVKITHTLYYTPSGRSVDKNFGEGGLQPHVVVALGEEDAKNRLEHLQQVKAGRAQGPFIDTQMQEALRLLGEPEEYAQLLDKRE